MKKIILLILVFISLVILIARFSATPLSVILGVKERAGIRVLSKPEGALVYINDAYAGKTPYEDSNLEVLEYKISIQSDNGNWDGRVKLKTGTLTVINRELSPDQATSSGEILTLEKGQGVTVISSPSEADIEVDGKIYGKTPTLVNITSGEHTFVLSRANYLKRSIKAVVPEDFNLTLNVDLSLSEADLTNIPTEPQTQTTILIVKATPTGFLRVREKPTINSAEVVRLKPKDEVSLIEDLGDWYRIRLQNGKEGYVSAAYVDKKP
jgi:hypothetical protein